MRLGFNWAMGPFEMLKSIGVKNFFERIDDFKGNKFLENLRNIAPKKHFFGGYLPLPPDTTLQPTNDPPPVINSTQFSDQMDT